jgi:UDP-N-acetylglucosamine 2-epimerase (non-hydrolysing)
VAGTGRGHRATVYRSDGGTTRLGGEVLAGLCGVDGPGTDRAPAEPTRHTGRMPDPVVHVVGARPNFVKAAPVIAALTGLGVDQRIVHTGQHYSEALSDVFFRDLGLPEPDRNLGVGSGSHGVQTAALLMALEAALLEIRPSLVVLYGDVNSTLAGAVVAAKLGLRSAHVEAGLRSFDRSMPEEVNRVVTDALADLCFATSPEAIAHLAREGVATERIHFVGNPMIDTLLAHRARFDPAPLRAALRLPEAYGVVTLHRPANVDVPAAAERVARAVVDLSALIPLVVPLHPRGRAALAAAGLEPSERIRVVEPLGYLDFLSLVSGARLVLTDSGGIQEESTILGVPCLTVRPNTERPITISHGTNRLVEPEAVVTAAGDVLSGAWEAPPEPPPLWDGHAGPRIARVIATEISETALAR